MAVTWCTFYPMEGYHCQSKAALVPCPVFLPPYPAPADTNICTQEQGSKNYTTTLAPDCKGCCSSWPDPASHVLHKLLVPAQVTRQQWSFHRLCWLKSFSWTTDWQLQSVSQYILLWLKVHILCFFSWLNPPQAHLSKVSNWCLWNIQVSARVPTTFYSMP